MRNSQDLNLSAKNAFRNIWATVDIKKKKSKSQPPWSAQEDVRQLNLRTSRFLFAWEQESGSTHSACDSGGTPHDNFPYCRYSRWHKREIQLRQEVFHCLKCWKRVWRHEAFMYILTNQIIRSSNDSRPKNATGASVLGARLRYSKPHFSSEWRDCYPFR